MIDVRNAFEHKAGIRLGGIVSNWRTKWLECGEEKGKPKFMADIVWQGLIAHWKTPAAQEKSQSASTSRNTPVAPGDVSNRHRLGQMSIAGLRLNMAEESETHQMPPIVDVLDRAYRRRDGSYTTKRAEKTKRDYDLAVSQELFSRESQGESDPVLTTQELDEIYKRVAPRKKGRPVGIGCTDDVAACSSSSQYHRTSEDEDLRAEVVRLRQLNDAAIAEGRGLRAVVAELVAISGNAAMERMLNNVPHAVPPPPPPPPPSAEQQRAHMEDLGNDLGLSVDDYI